MKQLEINQIEEIGKAKVQCLLWSEDLVVKEFQYPCEKAGCAFRRIKFARECIESKCFPFDRDDNRSVYFKKIN